MKYFIKIKEKLIGKKHFWKRNCEVRKKNLRKLLHTLAIYMLIILLIRKIKSFTVGFWFLGLFSFPKYLQQCKSLSQRFIHTYICTIFKICFIFRAFFSIQICNICLQIKSGLHLLYCTFNTIRLVASLFSGCKQESQLF